MKKFSITCLSCIIIGSIVALIIYHNRSLDPQTDDLPSYAFGDTVDTLNGVAIYYNGSVSTSNGRHLSNDGYNFGLRFQCVEFVKRYYFQHLGHRMPNTWGHAKDFYDPSISNGQINPSRALIQFQNGAGASPQVNDLIIFGPSKTNAFGHVAIVSKVGKANVEITQQNPGPQGKSRITLPLTSKNDIPEVKHDRVLGWLRLPNKTSPQF